MVMLFVVMIPTIYSEICASDGTVFKIIIHDASPAFLALWVIQGVFLFLGKILGTNTG